jgi:arylsulfatase A-like enzyme
VACDRRPEPRNVVLITLDTVRADHLTPYGYARGTVPTLDAFASEAVQFQNALTSCTMTAPSHASILTGMHWGGHGVVTNGLALFPNNHTLAEILSHEGFRTGAFVSARSVLGRRFNFDQGFEVFEEGRQPQRRARAVVDEAIEFLDGIGDERFFVWLHLYDAHCPYTPPGRYASMFTQGVRSDIDPVLKCGKSHYNLMDLSTDDVAYLRGLYDGELAYMDGQLRRFFAHLEDRGLTDETLFVITSDHGEELGDRGKFGHNFSLRRWEVRVPMWFRWPHLTPRTIDDVVSTTDIVPTIASLLGFGFPSGVDGHDLTPLLGDDTEDVAASEFSSRPIFSLTAPDERSPNAAMVRVGRWKLIGIEGGDAQLYEVATGSPRLESREERPDLHHRLRTEIDAWIGQQTGRLEDNPVQIVPDDVRQQLEALGYVD